MVGRGYDTEAQHLSTRASWMRVVVLFVLLVLFAALLPCAHSTLQGLEDQRQAQQLPLNCHDYNSLPAYAALHGLDGKDLFVCPSDGIASVKCNATLPMKAPADIQDYKESVAVTWDDILVLMLYGKDFKGREKVVDWWAGSVVQGE